MSDAPSLRCLVTGATSGIGRATTTALAARGHHVLVHGRRQAGIDAVVAEARQQGGMATGVLADLADLTEVRRMAAEVIAHGPLDVLVLNAGGYLPHRQETAQGLEWCFGVNHLANTVTARLLLPHLARSPHARVVALGSRSHAEGRLRWHDLQREQRRYWGYLAYCDSKLAFMLAMRALASRVVPAGVAVDIVDPGTVSTGFGQDAPGFFRSLFEVGRFTMRTPERGADTVVWLATRPDTTDTGAYWKDRRQIPGTRRFRSEADAERIWSISEALAGSLPPVPSAPPPSR